MPALVEKMVYADAVPWHGLGNKITRGASIPEIQKQAGLEFVVQERTLFFEPDETLRVVPNHKVLYRNTDYRVFSVVHQRYKVVQPEDILNFYQEIIGDDESLYIDTAGSLKRGARIWALAKSNKESLIRHQDPLRAYLLLATSYDKSFSTLVQWTSVRVVCNNTLSLAVGQDYKDGVLRIPHTSSFDVKSVRDKLALFPDMWSGFTVNCDELARIKLDVEKATAFVNSVFKVPEDEEKSTELGHAKRVIHLYENSTYRGGDLEAAQGTAWGLLNATTEYVDFYKNARGQDTRLDSAWFGEGATIKGRMWNILTENLLG